MKPPKNCHLGAKLVSVFGKFLLKREYLGWNSLKWYKNGLMIRKFSSAKGMFSTKISLAKGIWSKTGAAHPRQNFFRSTTPTPNPKESCCCLACRTYEIATRFLVVVICPIIKCLTVLEFSFVLFDLCLFIKIFNFFFNYVLIVTFWIFTYHKIWVLSIIYCFIWNYWIIYFLTCLEVFWSVVS